MSECILHNRATVPGGYGKRTLRGCATLAHRHAYAEAHGLDACKDLRGLVVMHTCDNPRCVNPDHLVLGTQQDNVDDMMRKGRNVPGHRGPPLPCTWRNPC